MLPKHALSGGASKQPIRRRPSKGARALKERMRECLRINHRILCCTLIELRLFASAAGKHHSAWERCMGQAQYEQPGKVQGCRPVRSHAVNSRGRFRGAQEKYFSFQIKDHGRIRVTHGSNAAGVALGTGCLSGARPASVRQSPESGRIGIPCVDRFPRLGSVSRSFSA